MGRPEGVQARSVKENDMAETDNEYLKSCTTIAPEAIEEEFVRTPADVAYWNAQYAEALGAYLKAKLSADREWSRLWLLTRESLIAAGGKPTEATVEASVTMHPDWEKAQLALIEAEVLKTEAYGRVDAVHTKRDMLQSLGAKLRVEMQSDPQVRREQAQIHGRG